MSKVFGGHTGEMSFGDSPGSCFSTALSSPAKEQASLVHLHFLTCKLRSLGFDGFCACFQG